MIGKQANRREQPGNELGGVLVLAGVFFGLVALGMVLWVGSLVNPGVRDLPNGTGPTQVLGAFTGGVVDVTMPQVVVTVLLLLALSGLVWFAVWVIRGAVGSQSRIDHKARYMAQPKDLEEFYAEAAQKDAERLRATGAGIGVPLGDDMRGRALYASWEWVGIWLMGPRAGKTRSECVPQLLETNGPAIATSNKRDIVDMTRGPRSQRGVVWVHDVQDIIGERPTWWWNPLSYVTDIQTAERLADIFITSATDAGAKQDAYFGSAGKETLARLLLAAAIAHRPITDVFKWANDPESDDDPAMLLIEHGERALGEALGETQTLTEKQRDGVYGTIRPWIGVLGMRSVQAWIVDDGTDRPHFDAYAFAASTDTLYLISREGPGSARAITGALTMAVLAAAELVGSRQIGGRLTTPLMCVLDEVANVCRWRDLPDVYSHYGSRGIILHAYFQSWEQGVEAFGKGGMGKLWSAANVRVAGRGLSEEFLRFVADSIGPHDELQKSRSYQQSGSSTTSSLQRQTTLDLSELTGMPKGRAVMLASGAPAALFKLRDVSTRPYAAAVAASQKYYEERAAAAAHMEVSP